MLAKPEPELSPARVLVVEDEVLIRIVIADVLREAGLLVIEAATADDALAYLQAGGLADLVFSDIYTKGTLNGIGLAHHLRREYPDIPVILTTGHPGSHHLDHIGPFLRKPYHFKQALELVFKTLGLPLPEDQP